MSLALQITLCRQAMERHQPTLPDAVLGDSLTVPAVIDIKLEKPPEQPVTESGCSC